MGGVTVSGHTVTPKYKTITQGSGIKITGATSTISVDHTNSITAKTSFSNSATSYSGNGKSFKVPDIKYDTEGHITGIQTVTVTMPTDTDTKVTTNLTSASGEYPILTKDTTTATDSPTTSVKYGAGITVNPSAKTVKVTSGTTSTTIGPNTIALAESGTNQSVLSASNGVMYSTAASLNIGAHAQMTYNSTDKCITFSFV